MTRAGNNRERAGPLRSTFIRRTGNMPAVAVSSGPRQGHAGMASVLLDAHQDCLILVPGQRRRQRHRSVPGVRRAAGPSSTGTPGASSPPESGATRPPLTAADHRRDQATRVKFGDIWRGIFSATWPAAGKLVARVPLVIAEQSDSGNAVGRPPLVGVAGERRRRGQSGRRATSTSSRRPAAPAGSRNSATISRPAAASRTESCSGCQRWVVHDTDTPP